MPEIITQTHIFINRGRRQRGGGWRRGNKGATIIITNTVFWKAATGGGWRGEGGISTPEEMTQMHIFSDRGRRQRGRGWRKGNEGARSIVINIVSWNAATGGGAGGERGISALKVTTQIHTSRVSVGTGRRQRRRGGGGYELARVQKMEKHFVPGMPFSRSRKAAAGGEGGGGVLISCTVVVVRP